VQRRLYTVPLALLLLALGASSASAATRVVDNTPASKCKNPTPNVPANNFTTVQGAIDASNPNDTVLVCPGTYEEKVTIKRNTGNTVLNGLKVLANTTNASTIDAPATITGNDAIVTVSEARKVEFRRFKVTGPGPGSCNSIKLGVWVRDNGDAKVQENQVLNVRDEPFSGCQNGSGIQFGSFSDSGTPSDTSDDVSTDGDGTAIGNLVSGYQKNGITVNENGSNVLVDKNTVIGAGRTAITAQNGIQVGYDALAKVSNNKVDANYYTDPSASGYVSTGVLTVDPIGSGVQLFGNVLTNNQVNMENYGLDFARIYNNRASGGQYGYYNDANSTNNTYDRNRATDNSIFDCNDDSTGPKTAGTGNTWTNDIGFLSNPAAICN
jgi:hypothetical protein